MPNAIGYETITARGGSFRKLITVLPSDATTFSPSLEAVYIGGLGDLTVESSNGDIVTFVGISGWAFISVRRIYASSTATNIIGAR